MTEPVETPNVSGMMSLAAFLRQAVREEKTLLEKRKPKENVELAYALRSREKLLTFIFELQDSGLHMVLSPVMLKNITESMADADINRFVLALEQRVRAGVMMSHVSIFPEYLWKDSPEGKKAKSENYQRRGQQTRNVVLHAFIEQHILQVYQDRQGSASILPASLVSYTTMALPDLEELLHSNTWLVVLYMCLSVDAFCVFEE